MSSATNMHDEIIVQNTTSLTIPEVSLITSWYIPVNDKTDRQSGRAEPPQAIVHALGEGITPLDLYFLDVNDIDWYIQESRSQYKERIGRHAFVASLAKQTLHEIHKSGYVDFKNPPNTFQTIHPDNCLTRIATALRELMIRHYNGRLIGKLPHFTALATFFPHVSLPKGTGEDDRGIGRQQAIQAIRASLYLARCLGCRCVEIVGGAGVPGTKFKQRNIDSTRYRLLRMETFIDSLKEIFTLTPDNILSYLPIHEVPFLALELEPGPSFLLNEIGAVTTIFDKLDEDTSEQGKFISKHVRLCVDIAHAFFLGYSPKTMGKYKHRVGHLHCSDHSGDHLAGGAHASDLPPGTNHQYLERAETMYQYRPWMELAVKLANGREKKWFSGAVAVELEATNNLRTVLSSVSTVRRWLRYSAGDTGKNSVTMLSPSPPSPYKPQPHNTGENLPESARTEGVILVLDIGNSTKEITTLGTIMLKTIIEKLCRIVNRHNGSVMGFTGDGFIALFERTFFINGYDVPWAALNAARELHTLIAKEYPRTTSRVALHWGSVYIPTGGHLRGEIIGVELVTAVRLCQWLTNVIEPAMPREGYRSVTCASEACYRQIHQAEQHAWKYWGQNPIRGTDEIVTTYLLRQQPPLLNDTEAAGESASPR